jgi:hypothetical protein
MNAKIEWLTKECYEVYIQKRRYHESYYGEWNNVRGFWCEDYEPSFLVKY